MSTLIIIRTPFQAWLVEKVLEREHIEVFDVLYFTQNNSKEDSFYYEKLSLKARNSEYVFVPPQRFSILSAIMLKVKSRAWYKVSNYDELIFASIDAFFISSLAKAYPKAQVVTFDDGTANINPKSIYHIESNNLRVSFYRYLMNALPLIELKKRIRVHYTLYRNQENIVEPSRLRYIEGWTEKVSRNINKSKIYFLGAPFEEVMNLQEIDRLEKYARTLGIDVYVAHPREKNLLNLGTNLLDKKGRVAEEAIISDAKDASIVLVGLFSTVMLNIGPLCKECMVLLPKDSPQTLQLFQLSEKSGFNPILI